MNTSQTRQASLESYLIGEPGLISAIKVSNLRYPSTQLKNQDNEVIWYIYI